MADQFQSQMAIKPDQILEIIVRRRWLIVVPFCIALTIGLFYTFTANKTYEASTLILVQPQRVPANYIKSVVTSSINERINTISQQILSRSNLEKIIEQFGLFQNQKSMYLEDKVELLRKQVQVKVETTKNDADAFSIIFHGDDPQRVMKIANTLASYFMDENLKVREAQAVGTSEFLDAELEKTRKTLEEHEKQLAEYRTKYIGGTPDELETNLRTLDRLQQQISSKNEALTQAKNALALFESQVSLSREAALDQNNAQSLSQMSKTGKQDPLDDEQKLIVARNEYDGLLLKYTEKHPEVLKQKKIVEKLEKTVEENKTVKNDPDKKSIGTKNSDSVKKDIQLMQLRSQIGKIESEINSIELEMKKYQAKVEDTPKRELELQSLQRDYKNVQNVFNSLLDRKLEADLSVNMEKKQKGEQFRILDHASLPQKPISPNVSKLFLLSIASGLGVGAGLIFLLEVFDSSIRREEQIERDLDLKILAAIPPMDWAYDKMKKKTELVLFGCLSAYAVIFLSFFAILNYVGLDRTTNFIKSTLHI